MILWHIDLVKYLDDKNLLELYNNCCLLRGGYKNKNDKEIDYVYKHEYKYLVAYHFYVMMIMQERGYEYERKWWLSYYRGENTPKNDYMIQEEDFHIRYPEHNKEYLKTCIYYLKRDNIKLKITYDRLEEVLYDKLN